MSSKHSLLNEVADIIDSLHKTPKYSANGKPMVRVTDVKYGPLNLEPALKVDDNVFEEFSKRYTPSIGDIIITRVGSYGNTSYVVNNNFCLGQNTAAIIPKINPRYLYFVLNSQQLKNQIESSTVGSTQKTLSLKAISKLEIPRLSLVDEDSVANILGILDDKIILNAEVNQTLEQMAQAIFKSWFVDFEPVKAKIAALEAGGTEEDALIAAMQAISGKDKAQLARFKTEQPDQYNELRTTAELFPSAMQNSELGEIPEGWRVLTLSSMIDLIGGGTPKKSEPSFWNGNICWFSVKDVPANSNVFVVDTEEKITEEGLSRSSTKILPVGTTIITARGTVGKLALTGVPTAMNQSCYGVIASDGSGSCLNYLRLSAAVDTLKQNTHGAVFDTITRGTFDSVTQPYPCSELRDSFETAVAPLFGAIKGNLLQSNNLSAIRDLLLPKLLAGDIGIVSSQLEMESS